MTINTDLQRLSPGNRIRLFEVDGTAFHAEILRFHADTLAYTPEELAAAGGDETQLPAKSIWWQGKDYAPWPVQIEGLETASDGQQAQPKLTVANLNGVITALCLKFDDLLQAKVIIGNCQCSCRPGCKILGRFFGVWFHLFFSGFLWI